MKTLKNFSPEALSNEALLKITYALVAEERKLTTEILWHLHEIQVRRLFAEKGYGSLFEYAVQALGYSEAAAGRRIAAMRLLVDVPEIEPALQKGSVSLSTLSTIQSFIQRKEKPVSRSEKKELVMALQGKSRRECEKHLVALDPIAAAPKERERVVSPTQTEIRFVADDALKKTETVSTPPAELKSQAIQRYIPAALKREVWKRDQGQCSYRSLDGKRCGSRFALEIDHIKPFALGGYTILENLRLLCRAHNTHQAIMKIGPQTMRAFVR